MKPKLEAGIKSCCMRCNIYQLKCDGKRLWIMDYDCMGRPAVGCGNRIFTTENDDSPIQIKAFFSLYAAKKRVGLTNEMAFAGAIVNTSDEKFAEARRLRPELVAIADAGIKDKPRSW